MEHGEAKCNCIMDYTGDNCEIAPDPCSYPGICADYQDCVRIGMTIDYTCPCKEGVTLPECEDDLHHVYHYEPKFDPIKASLLFED